MVQRGVRITRRDPRHRKRNLLNQLFKYGKIETTFARAQKISPLVEGLIEKAKKGGLPARRYLLRYLDSSEAERILEEVAPRLRNIKGGYTRIRKTAQRRGDAALMSTIEILEGEKIEIKYQKAKIKKEDKEKGRKRKSPKPSVKTAKQSERKSASKAKSRKHH